MSLAASLKKAAGKAIGKFGGDVTIRYVTAGGYDTATGTIPDHEIGLENVTVKGVLEDANVREANELIQAGDKKLMVAANDLDTAPETKDRVVIGGLDHQVISVKTTEQDSTAIVYELILRV
tara:strand:+ start:825 stop:1190 length:366 start_codon:yes stop_codon:yes gene_type:complete